MAHAPKGFTGTVDQSAEAVRFAMAAAPFRVKSSSDWPISVVGGVDRTLRIGTGVAQACGVTDTTNAAEDIQFPANSSGATRYDALVARFDWTSTAVTFGYVTGGATPPALQLTTPVDNAKINRIPGTRYDALLAVVPVTSGVGTFPTSGAGAFVDCRPWGGIAGPLVIPTSSYRDRVDVPLGGQLFTDDTDKLYRNDAGSLVQVGSVEYMPFLGEANGSNGTAGSAGVNVASAAVTVPSGLAVGRRIRVLAYAWVDTPGGVGATITITSSAGFSQSRSLNAGDLYGDVVLEVFDSNLTSGGRTYFVNLKTTVSGQSLDYRQPHLSVVVI